MSNHFKNKIKSQHCLTSNIVPDTFVKNNFLIFVQYRYKISIISFYKILLVQYYIEVFTNYDRSYDN